MVQKNIGHVTDAEKWGSPVRATYFLVFWLIVIALALPLPYG